MVTPVNVNNASKQQQRPNKSPKADSSRGSQPPTPSQPQQQHKPATHGPAPPSLPSRDQPEHEYANQMQINLQRQHVEQQRRVTSQDASDGRMTSATNTDGPVSRSCYRLFVLVRTIMFVCCVCVCLCFMCVGRAFYVQNFYVFKIMDLKVAQNRHLILLLHFLLV